MLDTGLDYTHPSLSGSYIGGWEFVDNDAVAWDPNGHGTHVAGIIAGSAASTYPGVASQHALDATWPTLTNLGTGVGWRIQYKVTYAAGEATVTGLAEVVLTNETPITNVAGTAANTIARALLSPTVNKGASDTLAITWNHDFLGA